MMIRLLLVLSFALIVPSLSFAQLETNYCSLIPDSKKCVDSTPCKMVGDGLVCLSNVGLPSGATRLPQACWQYSYDFACPTQTVNTCTPYENNSACGIVSSRCADTIAETGKCSQYINTYSCSTSNEVKEERLICSSGVFSDAEIPKPVRPNDTFAKAAVAQEIMRQGATYSKEGKNAFAGVLESCTKGYAGIRNCCKAIPGAQSNSAVVGLAISGGISTAKYAGSVAVDVASPYVFDAMFAGGEFMAGLGWDLATSSSSVVFDFASNSPVGTGFSAGGPSLGAYGFTFQSGTAAAGSGLLGANTTLATFGGGNYSITFNPYVFAAMVAIQVIQQLAACDNTEQLLGMHKGANLSVYKGVACDKKILGSCVLYRESYCSFNSLLAKIINTQGKPQLGLSTADCSGFAVEEISKLDFTKIDFSEFTNAMSQQATKNTPTNIKGSYTPLMEKATGGSAQGTNPIIPSYPTK